MIEKKPKPTKPTIPEPVATVDGLYRTVSALKQAVEHMQGLSGLAERNKAHQPAPERKPTVFVQAYEPQDFQAGDFWLSTSSFTTSLSVAVNGFWQVIWP